MVPTRTQLPERTVSNPLLDNILLFVSIQPDSTVLKKACAYHFTILPIHIFFSPKYELPPPNWDDGIGARPMQQDRDRGDEVRVR